MNVGGIVGSTGADNVVSNAYNSGIVLCTNESMRYTSGEIVGVNGNGSAHATVENCYSKGVAVHGDDEVLGACLVGHNTMGGIINNCYYNSDITVPPIGRNDSTELVSVFPKLLSEIQSPEFISQLNGEEFEFDEHNANGGYPILLWKTNIQITREPTKIMYKKDEEDLDLSGGKIKLKYNYSQYDTILDMDNEKISVSGFSNEQEGIVNLNLVYRDEEFDEEFEKRFSVLIVDDTSVPECSVTYSTTELTNKDVTVTITANEQIQGVEGWRLAKDKMSLTKVYSENTDGVEEIIVKDLIGNETIVNVNITNIDKVAPELSVEYSITEKTNKEVTATITANEQIQEVEGWTISENLSKLSKIFTVNNEEIVTVKDLAGNEATIKVVINNIGESEIEIQVDYSTTVLTNQNVNVTITCNKRIKEIPSWTISQDEKILSKVFEQNGQEDLTIYDYEDNSRDITINVSNIDKIKPEVNIEYSNTELTSEDIIVTIKANEIIQQIEGWNLR